MSFLDIFTISPLQRPREISQNVSGLYYVGRGAGYKIHICAKLYYLGRAKVFSSVATDFGSWTSQTVSKLWTGHECSTADGRTDGWTDRRTLKSSEGIT